MAFIFSKFTGSLIGTSMTLLSLLIYFVLAQSMEQSLFILLLITLSSASLLADYGKFIMGIGYFVVFSYGLCIKY